MTYHSTQPSVNSLEDLKQWCQGEFTRIEREFSETIALDLRSRHQAPTRPREGMIVYADGTDWNPGSGEGPYYYDGGSWRTMAYGAFASAWGTSFTPVVTASAGSITSYTATCRYVQLGKMIFVHIGVSITNVGTATGEMLVTLPVAEQGNRIVLNGVDTFTGRTVGGYSTSGTLHVNRYDNATILATGAAVHLSGVYEAA